MIGRLEVEMRIGDAQTGDGDSPSALNGENSPWSQMTHRVLLLSDIETVSRDQTSEPPQSPTIMSPVALCHRPMDATESQPFVRPRGQRCKGLEPSPSSSRHAAHESPPLR